MSALGLVAVLQLLTLWLMVRDRWPGLPVSIDVTAKRPKGELPGGTYTFVAGLGPDPILPSGALVLEVQSDRAWVHEVWARTDHGWVQLQPGGGSGTFRNTLLSGVRLSAFRLWLAPVGQPADDAELRRSAALLIPAAMVLARAGRGTPVPAHHTTTPPPTGN